MLGLKVGPVVVTSGTLIHGIHFRPDHRPGLEPAYEGRASLIRVYLCIPWWLLRVQYNTHCRTNNLQNQIRQIGGNNNCGLLVNTTGFMDWPPDFRHRSTVMGLEYVTLIIEKTLRINRAIRERNLRVVSPEVDEGWRILDHRIFSTSSLMYLIKLLILWVIKKRVIKYRKW